MLKLITRESHSIVIIINTFMRVVVAEIATDTMKCPLTTTLIMWLSINRDKEAVVEEAVITEVNLLVNLLINSSTSNRRITILSLTIDLSKDLHRPSAAK